MSSFGLAVQRDLALDREKELRDALSDLLSWASTVQKCGDCNAPAPLHDFDVMEHEESCGWLRSKCTCRGVAK